MWIAHYLAGLFFYTTLPLSLTVYSIPTLPTGPPASIRSLLLPAPSLKTFLALPLFFLASGFQHDAHVHLASLVKYSLPRHPLFVRIVCPHYGAECLVYLALAVLAAPKGLALNPPVAAGLVFVATILGVSAAVNREWYRQKFGEEAVRGKWNMLPFVY